jgi:subtilase family serine protease
MRRRGDIALGSRAVLALASGASNAGATLVTIPAGTATGTYNILAEADGAHVLFEKNEANNLSSRILRVGPDLVTAVRGITGTLRAGATISVQDLTSNPSAAAVLQSTTGYYLSTDNRLDAADVRIGSRAIPALAAPAWRPVRRSYRPARCLGRTSYWRSRTTRR